MFTAFAIKNYNIWFLSDHDINICLVNETHLKPGQDFQMANYVVCHMNDRPTQRGGTITLSVVASIIICDCLKPAADGSHRQMCKHLWEASQTRGGLSITTATPGRCISGGKPVLLTGDLNVKHNDWNSGLNSPSGFLLKVCAHEPLHLPWTRCPCRYS